MEIWLNKFRWIWLCVSSSKDGVLAVRVVVVVEIVDFGDVYNCFSMR